MAQESEPQRYLLAAADVIALPVPLMAMLFLGGLSPTLAAKDQPGYQPTG
jgi:hypothetical protein